MWSDCSKTEFADWATGPLDTCTDTTDMALVLPLFGNTCGDGVIDEGEDCDCGFANCNATDTCCDGITCKYTMPDADCASSQDCCNEETCQLYKTEEEFVCRAGSDCSAAETCNTGLPDCPPDELASVLSECNNGAGHCDATNCFQYHLDCHLFTGSDEVCSLEEIALFKHDNECIHAYCRNGSPDYNHVDFRRNITVGENICSAFSHIRPNGNSCTHNNVSAANFICQLGSCNAISDEETLTAEWRYVAPVLETDCCAGETRLDQVESEYVCSKDGIYIYSDLVCAAAYKPATNFTSCESITCTVVSATDEDEDSGLDFLRDSILDSVYRFFADLFGDPDDDDAYIGGVLLTVLAAVVALFLLYVLIGKTVLLVTRLIQFVKDGGWGKVSQIESKF